MFDVLEYLGAGNALATLIRNELSRRGAAYAQEHGGPVECVGVANGLASADVTSVVPKFKGVPPDFSISFESYRDPVTDEKYWWAVTRIGRCQSPDDDVRTLVMDRKDEPVPKGEFNLAGIVLKVKDGEARCPLSAFKIGLFKPDLSQGYSLKAELTGNKVDLGHVSSRIDGKNPCQIMHPISL